MQRDLSCKQSFRFFSGLAFHTDEKARTSETPAEKRRFLKNLHQANNYIFTTIVCCKRYFACVILSSNIFNRNIFKLH